MVSKLNKEKVRVAFTGLNCRVLARYMSNYGLCSAHLIKMFEEEILPNMDDKEIKNMIEARIEYSNY